MDRLFLNDKMTPVLYLQVLYYLAPLFPKNINLFWQDEVNYLLFILFLCFLVKNSLEIEVHVLLSTDTYGGLWSIEKLKKYLDSLPSRQQ